MSALTDALKAQGAFVWKSGDMDFNTITDALVAYVEAANQLNKLLNPLVEWQPGVKHTGRRTFDAAESALLAAIKG